MTSAPPSNGAPPAASSIKDPNDKLIGTWMPHHVLQELHEQPEQNSTSPLSFFHILQRLKTTKREGWRRFGILDGESISDHMYRMAIITMLAPPSLAARLDLNRCTKMALVHDMAELLVGDITPVDNIPKPEKNRREQTTMDYLCTNLLGNVGGGQAGTDIRALWQEYEDSKTPESIFVHDVDKVELLLQMIEYEKTKQGPPDLYEFAYVASKVETPEVKEWADQLIQEQQEFWLKIGKAHGSVAALESTRPHHKKAMDQYYDEQ